MLNRQNQEHTCLAILFCYNCNTRMTGCCMKINTDRINTALYAIRKKIQGYELLKNPKGNESTGISMIKSSFGIVPESLDDVFMYHKIQRKCVNGNIELVEKTLIAEHFIDPVLKLPLNKKNLLYTELKNGKLVRTKERTDISPEEYNARTKGKIKKTLDESFIETNAYYNKRFTKERKKLFYQPKISLIENILSLGFAKALRSDSRPYARSFFSTLISNLKVL